MYYNQHWQVCCVFFPATHRDRATKGIYATCIRWTYAFAMFRNSRDEIKRVWMNTRKQMYKNHLENINEKRLFERGRRTTTWYVILMQRQREWRWKCNTVEQKKGHEKLWLHCTEYVKFYLWLLQDNEFWLMDWERSRWDKKVVFTLNSF